MLILGLKELTDIEQNMQQSIKRIHILSLALIRFKMESIRKLSNQWTKTLYQNNLKFIAFFFTLFKSYRRN